MTVLVTKPDLFAVKSDLAADIRAVQSELLAVQAGLKAEISSVRSDLQAAIDKSAMQMSLRLGGLAAVSIGILAALQRMH